MDNPPSRKEVTHERIVTTAAREIRRGGFHGVGVADFMKEAGLTHGGFYAHFSSRNALLAEALERAGQDSAARVTQGIAARQARGASPLRALVEGYLSDRHLGDIEAGCPVAALVSEMPRQSPEVRESSAQRVRGLLAGLGAAFAAATKKSTWALGSCTACVLLAAVAIICAAMAVKPRTGGPASSLLFFGKVRRLSEPDFTHRFKKATDEDLLADYSAQIHRNAEIASAKHDWVGKAVMVSFMSAIPWLSAIGFLTF